MTLVSLRQDAESCNPSGAIPARSEDGRTYASRDRVLRAMGFANYGDYLRSPLWLDIRSRVMAGGKTCAGCASKATQVHHRNYSLRVMSGDDASHLVPICRQCHEQIEFKKDGKCSLQEANHLLDLLSGAKLRPIRRGGYRPTGTSKWGAGTKKPSKKQRKAIAAAEAKRVAKERRRKEHEAREAAAVEKKRMRQEQLLREQELAKDPRRIEKQRLREERLARLAVISRQPLPAVHRPVIGERGGLLKFVKARDQGDQSGSVASPRPLHSASGIKKQLLSDKKLAQQAKRDAKKARRLAAKLHRKSHRRHGCGIGGIPRDAITALAV